MRRLALFALAFAAGAARADGLDRDTLLTDSPAVPNAGTVRVTGGATGSTSDASTTGGNNGTSGVSGSVSWTPIANVSGDVGAYTQIGASGGVSARVRYQFLSQARHGIDLSGGLRFKTISWHASAAPAVSWMATRTLQLQALIGVAQPKKTDLTTPVGVVSASIDF
ncbi:MAG: hypothetical protein LC689_16850 [Myxococcales bacterium]|nr:hypothetical protein [Myxococcales bacterium]